MKESSRVLVVASLMLAMFLAAIEATIVATAMPTIIGSLGGFRLYSWVFSAFLLTQGAFIPIFGRLSDLYGRKPVFTVATLIFLLGAFLSGHARSMEQLIIFRAVQGLGAAGVQPITQTIIGDIFTLEERARVQGWLSSVWGISSVAGPTLGGLIVDHWSWPWIFYINIPLGLIAIAGLWLFLRERPAAQRHSIDYAGSALLVTAVTALLVFVIEGGSGWPWLSAGSLGFLGLAAGTGAVFLWWENRVAEPLLPPGLFANRVIAFCDLAVVFSGALTLGISSFTPTLVQGVMGTSATVAGLALGAMSLGWPLASTFSGRLMLRIGYRSTAIAGSFFTIISAGVMLSLPYVPSVATAALGSFLMGMGMGLTSTTFIVAVQGAVSWEQRGVATSSNAFMRMLGSTVGVAVFGNILNNGLVRQLASLPDTVKSAVGTNPDVARMLLDPVTRHSLPAWVLQPLRDALFVSVHGVYVALAVTAVAGALVVRLIPRGLPDGLQARR